MCACRRWGGLVVGLQTAPRPAKRGHLSLRGEPSGSFASAVAAAATVARRTPLSGRAPRGWALAGAACLGVAALSLLVSHEPTYDPAAWLIWGREILHGDLSTTAGPSWKPLPILVTAPAALLGDAGQQDVWLIVARGGALAALVLCYRLAWRLEGPVAGVLAALALLVSSGYATRTFRGDSEGVLVALAFGAIEAHLVGRRRLAFGLFVATALLRPEMWLFAGLYGLWLAGFGVPPARRAATLAIAAAIGLVVVAAWLLPGKIGPRPPLRAAARGAAPGAGVAAWLVPEKIGSGQLLRAASRALEPVAGSPATASVPFVATFTNAAPVLPWPLYAAGVVYVVAALRDRRRPGRGLTLALAAIATALMVIVALMAEMGFTGNSRYLTIPIALTGILGGAGLVRIASWLRSRLGARPAGVAIAALAVLAFVVFALAATRTRDQVRGGMRESERYAALPSAIASAGGAKAVLACRPIYTEWFGVQAVALALHVHSSDVSIHPRAPGTVVARRGARIADPRRFPAVRLTDQWVFASSCRR